MRTRRGLSSVVGTVFAIIALSTTLAYVSYSMNILDQYNQAVISKNQASLNQGQEKFQVTSATFVNNKFNITVSNTGNLPINFTKLWIQNTTDTGDLKRTFYYSLSNSLASPGGILKNIGQSIGSYSFMTNQAYNIKLVTSRGNTQAFTVNSVNTAPLNIQLLALPSTVPSGFTTQLVMLVTNNGSSTLVNVAPQTPTLAGAATCTLGTVSPPIYNTLPPGETAVFSWTLTAFGSGGQTCTSTGQLQNGYPGQTVQATVTVRSVTLASTTYAQTAGTLTINYTSWKWSQGGGWHLGWALPKNTATAFSLQLTNNNVTGTFYVSKLTQLAFFPVGSTAPTAFFIVNATNVAPTPPTLTAFSCTGPPSNNYCITLAPQQTITIYFAANGQGVNTIQTTPNQVMMFTGNLVLFGKYDTSQNGSGSSYAQNIPYIAIDLT